MMLPISSNQLTMWTPNDELRGLIAYVSEHGISPQLIMALYLRLATSDQATAAIKATEALSAYVGDVADDGGAGVSFERAQQIAKLAKRLLYDDDLNAVLGDVAFSVGESEENDGDITGAIIAAGLRQNNVSGVSPSASQSDDHERSEPSGIGVDTVSGDSGSATPRENGTNERPVTDLDIGSSSTE